MIQRDSETETRERLFADEINRHIRQLTTIFPEQIAEAIRVRIEMRRRGLLR